MAQRWRSRELLPKLFKQRSRYEEAHDNPGYQRRDFGLRLSSCRTLSCGTLAINMFSEIFAEDNSAFQLGRFERACVPGANVRARTNGGAHND
jgi:hypothetical protein